MRTWMHRLRAVAAVALAGALLAPASDAVAVPTVVSATGATAASITPARDAFRVALGGGTVAGANGSFGGVRREINWDGVPDAFAAPNNLPANFFNSNSPRGVVFSTPGTGFQVSAAAGVAPINFGNINPTYSTTFAPFSPQRLFTPLGSNVTDVNFFLPGTSTPATVSGFGAVLSDVDSSTSTTLQFFDAAGTSLGTFAVPATSGTATFSFLGVVRDPGVRAAKVRLVTGQSPLGASTTDGLTDLVVMDDFIYAEPGNPAGTGSGTGTPPVAPGLTSTAGTGTPDTSAPGVSSYRLTNNPFVVAGGSTPTLGSAATKKHKTGTTFRYRLSEAATVNIAISQRRSGRRKGKRCVAPTRKRRKARKCTRITRKGTLTRLSHAGVNSVAFTGKIGSKPLSPGTYQATLLATDAASNTSSPKTIFFTIVKR